MTCAAGSLGYLAGTNEPGTRALFSCQSGADTFTSSAPGCEGRQMLERLGWIWLQPPEGVPSAALYRCRVTSTGEHFDANSAGCEGHQLEGLLGYLLTGP